MRSRAYHLGELVYMTNRLARGSPDAAFTETSGPGMVVGVTHENTKFKPRYRVRWLKSGIEMIFHADCLMPVGEKAYES